MEMRMVNCEKLVEGIKAQFPGAEIYEVVAGYEVCNGYFPFVEVRFRQGTDYFRGWLSTGGEFLWEFLGQE